MVDAYLRKYEGDGIMFFDIPSDQYLTGPQKSVLLDAVGGVAVQSRGLDSLVYRLSPENLLDITTQKCMENEIKVIKGDNELDVSIAIKRALKHNSKVNNQFLKNFNSPGRTE